MIIRKRKRRQSNFIVRQQFETLIGKAEVERHVLQGAVFYRRPHALYKKNEISITYDCYAIIYNIDSEMWKYEEGDSEKTFISYKNLKINVGFL